MYMLQMIYFILGIVNFSIFLYCDIYGIIYDSDRVWNKEKYQIATKVKLKHSALSFARYGLYLCCL